MPSANTLIVVEGPHDAEVVAALLKPAFSRIRKIEDLPQRWRRLVSTSFPFKGDLLARPPVPLFLRDDDDRIVTLVIAGSKERLPQNLMDALKELEFLPDAVAMLADADDAPPEKSHAELVHLFDRIRDRDASPLLSDVRFPDKPGVVSVAPPCRTGVYIAPNNEHQGTIEHLLLEGARVEYPALLDQARSYVARLSGAWLDGNDFREFRKPFGAEKATVHAIGVILKPGKAIQMSIRDSRWLQGEARNESVVHGLVRFLRELLD